MLRRGCESCPLREETAPSAVSFFSEQNNPMEMVLSSYSLSLMTNEQLMSVIDSSCEDTIKHYGDMFTRELNKRGDSMVETIQNNSFETNISNDEATEAWLSGNQPIVDNYLNSLE